MFENIRIIRYIGNKTNLYDFIIPKLKEKLKNKQNFYELFSGTNAISFKINGAFNNKDFYANDLSLFSNIIYDLLKININNINKKKLMNFMKDIDNLNKYPNNIEYIIFNEFSMNGNPKTINKNDMFIKQEYNGRMYFPENIGKKIDIIRYNLKINQHNLNNEEKIIILNMLLNYADKNANTTGVYGAYLKNNKIKEKCFYNEKLFKNILNYITNFSNKNNYKFYKDNILNFINNNNININNSVIYLDPPYNSRDYQTLYHILNYIVDENFDISYIKENSKTAVPIKRFKNISSSRKNTIENFTNILKKLNNNNNDIFISYSEEGLLTLEDYYDIAKNLNYNIEVFKQPYKKYVSKKETENKKIYEYLIYLY